MLNGSHGPIVLDKTKQGARPRPDAVTILTLYCVLLIAIPADQGIAALGSLGSPAVLVGIGAGIWWCWHQLHRRWTAGNPRAPMVRTAMFLFLLSGLASYVAAATRAIPAIEISPSDSGLLRILSWLGIFLLACDGIPTRERFDTLIRRMILTGALFAALGLLQFVTGQSLIDGLYIPGLSTGGFDAVQDRGGFTRSAATAAHPLEYGVVLCMVLPLALAAAMHESSKSAVRRWLPASLMVLAVVLSVSRSAMLGLLAELVVLVPTWPRRVRRYAIAVSLAGLVAIWLLVPGFVATVRGLFLGAADDAGVNSRTNSYDLAGEFFARSPLFGRGFGTFLPQYRIMDNQYLLQLMETGVVGVAALLGVIISGILCARSARRASRDSVDRALSQAIVASIVAGATLFAFFDALSFPKAGGTMFLILGLSGGWWRLRMAAPWHDDPNTANRSAAGLESPALQGARTSVSQPDRRTGLVGALRSRWHVGLAGAALTAFAITQVSSAPLVYTTRLEIVLLPPSVWGDGNALQGGYEAVLYYAGVVQRVVAGNAPPIGLASAQATLYGAGITDGSTVALVNTGGQWATSITRPVIGIEIVNTDRQRTIDEASALSAEVQSVATDLQVRAGAEPDSMMQVKSSPAEVDVQPVGGSRNRARAGIVAIGAALTLSAAWRLENSRARRRRVRRSSERLDLHTGEDELT
jgi:O-antigen ligase